MLRFIHDAKDFCFLGTESREERLRSSDLHESLHLKLSASDSAACITASFHSMCRGRLVIISVRPGTESMLVGLFTTTTC
mmetsp:Transcript_14956/g.22498  ORF Transcript_14956/g.22498 Transcript_14956/m.22498 type:complete len:80 (+) Transcript_14956:869-1108(+)